MAFKFNWSPLMADTSRAREMLTVALNKTPKPPIIVDDIVVTELNLGSVPPDLEILEVGDLAEDRFRGIFKMTYQGDAFLTLKTRVQANPLNTYLSAKPSFASPQPLAASSGLTIPLQITLSDIRLSGFVIVVFSRQKGLTIVFRNDPLEGLKVSSTFDSIPFVRDYLQKEIEGQLRLLFMDDLPAILHRLSLRYLVPGSLDRADMEERVRSRDNEIAWIDPLSAPPQPMTDSSGADTEENMGSVLSNEASSEHYMTFSKKNMSRLASLAETHRTLSLQTPIIEGAVFRAWTGPAHINERLGTMSPSQFSKMLYRGSISSAISSSASSMISGQDGLSRTSRPSLSSIPSFNGSTSSNGRSRQKQKKNRVVDLRRNKTYGGSPNKSDEEARPKTPEQRNSRSTWAHCEREGEVETPPQTPEQKHKGRFAGDKNQTEVDDKFQLPNIDNAERPPMLDFTRLKKLQPDTSTNSLSDSCREASAKPSSGNGRPTLISNKSFSFSQNRTFEKCSTPPMLNLQNMPASEEPLPSTSSILEQAMLLKMATDIARKANEDRIARNNGGWLRNDDIDDAPPAYVA